MSNYLRSTRECETSQLDPRLLRALQGYFESHQLGELESEVLQCYETISEKKKGGLPDWLTDSMALKIYVAVVLTGKSLIWARLNENTEQTATDVRVVGAELMNIRTRGKTSLIARDFGLEITGVIEGSKSNINGMIGLESGPAAEKLIEAVRQAIEKFNPTPERKWPAWMSGK